MLIAPEAESRLRQPSRSESSTVCCSTHDRLVATILCGGRSTVASRDFAIITARSTSVADRYERFFEIMGGGRHAGRVWPLRRRARPRPLADFADDSATTLLAGPIPRLITARLDHNCSETGRTGRRSRCRGSSTSEMQAGRRAIFAPKVGTRPKTRFPRSQVESQLGVVAMGRSLQKWHFLARFGTISGGASMGRVSRPRARAGIAPQGWSVPNDSHAPASSAISFAKEQAEKSF